MSRFLSKLIVFGAAMATTFVGCVQPQPDPATASRIAEMGRLAGKLRAYVTVSLDESNSSKAQNVAIASVIFAREMFRVAGKASELKSAPPTYYEPQEEPQFGLVRFSVVRARIESLVLNPSASVEQLTKEDYDSILRWALSENDMKILWDIRTDAGYWEDFKNTELRAE